MKIAWAIPDFAEPKTGGEKFYVRLKQNLSERTHFLCPKEHKFFASGGMIELIKVNLHNLGVLSRVDREAIILEEYSRKKYFFLANIILPLFFQRKYILFVHESYDFSEQSLIEKGAKKIINFIAFRLAKKIIVNSRSTSGWVNGFGDFKKKVFIFHPILKDSSEGKATTDRRGNVVKNLLCVANIRKNKGQEYLIEAFGLLEKKNLKLRLVGEVKENDYYDYLLSMIKNMGLSERVSFDGFLQSDELVSAYAGADIFILPTLKEGFGMVLMEAMSFGLPIIASNVGGIPELIEGGANGLLIPPASPKKIAEAIEKVTEDRELREYLGANALAKYRQLPSWDKTFEDLYVFLLV